MRIGETRIIQAAAAGGGALLALAMSLAGTVFRGERATVLPPVGAACWWVVDRDADALYALDRDRILAQRARIRRPLDVRSTPDGGAWILQASAGTSTGGRSLLRIRRDGSIETAIHLGAVTSWTVLDEGDALAIEDGRRLLRCSEDGASRTLLEQDGLACVAASGNSRIVGTRSGEIRRFSDGAEGAEPECARLDGPIVALAPSVAGAYVLFGEERTKLGILGADLSLLRTTDCPGSSAAIAPTPDGSSTWVVDAGGARIRKVDCRGGCTLEQPLHALPGIGRAVSTEAGGLLLLTPGAILAFDTDGRPEPGQGGFVFLAGADRIRNRRPDS